ncbi:GntR family transcriptional regulator [Burkholderia pyrrocinia]|uniref:GntR family transcriptional regulator n=1 Tax=Burkholderia pyrrocinia TaxID=60550 RepID=UPI002AB21D5E|nr:GntR family transcriptional regulator [Burkholderia pyrrocinia]
MIRPTRRSISSRVAPTEAGHDTPLRDDIASAADVETSRESVGSESLPEHRTIQERTYVLLSAMIKEGKIGPGENLRESDVLRAFGIGRAPARIALAALCRDGLIVQNEGRGYRVAVAPGQTVAESASKAASLDKVQVAGPPQWQQIYAELERELSTRVLLSSVRVTEEGLASYFDVSRTVVRIAMAQMQNAGLLSKNSGGHWIAEQVTSERVKHLLEMRRLLEPAALLQLAPSLPQELLRKSQEKLLDWTRVASPSGAELYDSERDLHIDLLFRSRNQEIKIALARTHILFEPTRWLAAPNLQSARESLGDALFEHVHIEDALQEHLEIFDTLLAGKPRVAATMLERHIVKAERRWIDRFEVLKQIEQPDLPSYLTTV